MGQVIYIDKWLSQKKEKEVIFLATKLRNIIDELSVEIEPKPYFLSIEEMNELIDATPAAENKLTSLSEITDILTETMISLDVLGHKIWADNLIMSFNIYYASSILDDVRAAELYDIPFKLLQSVEPGSNSLDAS